MVPDSKKLPKLLGVEAAGEGDSQRAWSSGGRLFPAGLLYFPDVVGGGWQVGELVLTGDIGDGTGFGWFLYAVVVGIQVDCPASSGLVRQHLACHLCCDR